MRLEVDMTKRKRRQFTPEFKALLASPEPTLKTIVAFANTAGGTVLFGVEDGTRRVVGVAEPLALDARIANLVADAIRPRLVPDIEIHPWRRTHLVAVHVFPSPVAPHYLKALGPEEGAFIRVGSSNRRADRTALDEMRRMASNRCFD
jgi:ATP-dependent DNA helicase RecG